MSALADLLASNRRWARGVAEKDPGFFQTLATQQSPKYLWVGCSDSRVPATEICGLMPGEMFVHRNVANVVVHTDINLLSVVQYAVEVLKVSDIIVCGHYGCGGVLAAMENQTLGLIDNWLRNIKDVYAQNRDELGRLEKPARGRRLCELNVLHQVANICHTSIVQQAWRNGQSLTVHSWIYGLNDGLLNDLGLSIDALEQLPKIYRIE
jgi:carbonic anhydrase